MIERDKRPITSLAAWTVRTLSSFLDVHAVHVRVRLAPPVRHHRRISLLSTSLFSHEEKEEGQLRGRAQTTSSPGDTVNGSQPIPSKRVQPGTGLESG